MQNKASPLLYYSFVEILGRGGFGAVVKASIRRTSDLNTPKPNTPKGSHRQDRDSSWSHLKQFYDDESEKHYAIKFQALKPEVMDDLGVPHSSGKFAMDELGYMRDLG